MELFKLLGGQEALELEDSMPGMPLEVYVSGLRWGLGRLDSDGDDLLSPRDCVKAFKGAAMMVKVLLDPSSL